MIEVNYSNEAMLSQKKDLVELFRPLLENKKVLFCDVPMYGNVGDGLIYLGTLELFKLLNVELLDCITAYEPSRIDETNYPKDVVVVLQGGGNFGDIYPLHQNFRKQVLSRFKDHKIIHMPQSIHFENETNLIKDAIDFNEHKDFSMFVRDIPSFEQLDKARFANLSLCPDVATLLTNVVVKLPGGDGGEKLYFLRKDKEAVDDSGSITPGAVDWVDIIAPSTKFTFSIAKKVIKYNNRLNIKGLTYLITKYYQSKLVKEALVYFSRYNTVRTDRLHGMIFSQVLGVKCEALDNSYGKLSRYIKAWYN